MKKAPLDISKSTTKTFAWRPHAQMGEEKKDLVILALCKNNCLPKISDLNRPDFWRNKVVLDAGCGVGIKTNAIAQLGAKQVIGVDGSAPSLREAKETTERLGLNNVIYIEGMLEEISNLLSSKAIAKVDYICCRGVIHHTTNWQSILQQFSNLLNLDGYLDIAWVDPTLGIRHGNSAVWFLLKNRISFRLGNSPESRLAVGQRLFGGIDRKFNSQSVEDQSFYADRYAAFYRAIPSFKICRALLRHELEIEESYPCLNIHEYLRQCTYTLFVSPKMKMVLETLVSWVPLAGVVCSACLRIKHFLLVGGTERRLIARKL